MSDLQIGLIILGLALVLAVVVFNAWQDWRARRRMRQQFPTMPDDVLLADAPPGRREPVLGRINDIVDDEIDPQCEAVIDISFSHPIAAAPLLDALQAVLNAADKPIRVFAQRDGDGQHAHLHAGEPCIALHLAVLLANRNGPLSAIAWSSIWTQAQSLAAQFDGMIEGPELDQVVQQAATLDALCATLEAQVNLQLRLTHALPSGQVREHAMAAGFNTQGQDFVWIGAHGAPRFTLLFDGAAAQATEKNHRVERLDLTLDLPNSPADAQSFTRMVDVARDLAQRVHANVVDDQGKPLADDARAAVDTQLAAIVERLNAAGFTPGDTRCARVFA